MLTQDRKRVQPLDYKPEDYNLEAVAHSLAMQCRYNGHVDWFYSVAQHGVLVSRALERDGYDRNAQRIGLHHDDAEYILGDMIRPMKNALQEQGVSIKPYELAIEKTVSALLGLSWPWPAIIHEYDNRIIRDEKEALKYDPTNTWDDFGAPERGLGVIIEEWDWRRAKHEFIMRHRELYYGS
jgi:hypothetical protein